MVDDAIARIEAANPELACVVVPLFERARERLRRADLAGPFAGVPMLLKDAGEELSDTPMWVGTQALRRSGHISRRTTALAGRFEELGSVIVGKSACPELSASSTTEPPGFEPTRNPWDLTRSVGGSSGGSAAAVAAGLVPIAHGSDGSGSLRFPAALCGVVTLKPTRGRIASTAAAGSPDPLDLWTQFAVARDVRDLIALFWWNEGHDILVSPVTLQPAWTLGEDAPMRTGMFAAPFSFTGQPAAVIPGGWTEDGRPVGVQLVGRVGSDELLLDFALDLQHRLGWLDRHPPAFQ